MIRDLPSAPKPFPFLKLPAEIRNEIYRLVLLTKNVTTCQGKAIRFGRIPGEGPEAVASIQPGEVAAGTIRCKSRRMYKLGYQISILRANRQIYHEALDIFHLENFWTLVRVNKAGFGKEMKDRGFAVATGGHPWRHIKFPVMKVRILFPLEDQEQSDTLAVATIHLEQLMRALWTAKGAPGMEVIIDVLQPPTNNSPSEHDLLRPFFKLRCIKRVIVSGVSKNYGSIDELRRAITTSNGMIQSFNELVAGIKCLQEYIKAERWEHAVAQAEKHAIHVSDCKIVYGHRFVGVESGLHVNTALARNQAVKDIMIATSMAFAEVTSYLGQYARSVFFADRALDVVSRGPIIATFFQAPPTANPTAVALPPTPLFTISSTTAFENEIKGFIFLIRARAYMGMRQAEPALRDIQKARDLMPGSVTLAYLSQAWEVMFRPVAYSIPPPPADASSSLAASTSIREG